MIQRIRTLAAWTIVVLGAGLSSGCTVISDFGRFMFGDGVDAGVDSGMADAGILDGGDVDASTDAGPIDAGPDAPFDAGLDAPLPDTGPRPPSTVVQTSGGAIISTPEYRLRISVGAPEPIGTAGDGTHRLRVGPAR
jgi:hypothetical protein